MNNITQYLTQLQADKETLVDNLVAKGVEASSDETFTTLAPKVADIETGGGATVKSNIYKVATLEERDAITDMVEGDMCVVQTSSIANMQVTDSVTAITFPATVVLPEIIPDYIFTSLRDAERTVDVMIDASSNNCRVNIMMDSDYLEINYESSDGITYTRTDTYAETVEFGVAVSCTQTEEWNDLIGYFLQIGGVIFKGIFEYKDSVWNYAKIGISLTPDLLYVDKKAYTNMGEITGTLTASSTNTFDDTDAKAYTEIHKNYNNMDVIVAPADSTGLYKTKKLYLIPTKIDGTSLLDTSNVTNMSNMFNGCINLTEIPLLNTSNTTDMSYLFGGCRNLMTAPLLDTSKVTNMNYMFSGCQSLTEIPQLDTGSATTARGMFASCTNLTSIPLLDTSSVTIMDTMFQNCHSLVTIPQLNTSNVTTMQYMFQFCENLETIPVLNTSKVTSLYQAFDGCKSLTSVPMWDTSANKSMYGIFRNCSSITSMPQWDTSNVSSWFLAFAECTSLVDFPVLSMASAGEMQNAFRGCPNLSDQSLENIMQSCITKGKLPYAKKASYLGLSAEQGERLKTLPSYSAWTALGWSV